MLKRAVPAPAAAHVALVRRDAADALLHLLGAVGKLYAAGAQPQPSRLYPAVRFPVSQGTPGLGSKVKWDHSLEWSVANFSVPPSGENIIEFDLSKADDAFIAGHNIDGRVLFPATGYLVSTIVTYILHIQIPKSIQLLSINSNSKNINECELFLI